jgi:hypothetical protein
MDNLLIFNVDFDFDVDNDEEEEVISLTPYIPMDTMDTSDIVPLTSQFTKEITDKALVVVDFIIEHLRSNRKYYNSCNVKLEKLLGKLETLSNSKVLTITEFEQDTFIINSILNNLHQQTSNRKNSTILAYAQEYKENSNKFDGSYYDFYRRMCSMIRNRLLTMNESYARRTGGKATN